MRSKQPVLFSLLMTYSLSVYISVITGMAADVGVLQRLPKIIGSASLTRELVFTGRKFFADEAKECGFVNRVFNSKDE